MDGLPIWRRETVAEARGRIEAEKDVNDVYHCHDCYDEGVVPEFQKEEGGYVECGTKVCHCKNRDEYDSNLDTVNPNLI